ncbi:MAG: ABC transporter permease [Spirochaetes bacterium]|nr:ABC transporter permease [Spirochaetota bacterium]
MKFKPSYIEPVLAWRNVWKNKRRTVLTLLTVTVGCAMLITFHALNKGGHDQMIEDAIEANTGHIQIHARGYWDARSIDYSFKPDERITSALKKIPGVYAFSERVIAGALLSNKNATAGAMIQAVDPLIEKKVSTLHGKVLKGGRYLNADDSTSIVLGETLAKNLDVKTGDTVTMLSQGFDGSIAAENLQVVGIFRSGNPEYDQGLALTPISLAKESFTMMDHISSIVIRLEDSDYTDRVREHLLKTVGKNELEIMGWRELMPELVQFIDMDDMGGYIFDIILFMVIAFGILNNIQMSVFERIREFGVMLAIGTRPGQVTTMVILEAMMIAFLGTVLGIILGSASSYYFILNPLNYSEYAKEFEIWGISTVIWPAKLTYMNIILTSVLTFVLSVGFSVFPARHAAKLKPIEAIRHL